MQTESMPTPDDLEEAAAAPETPAAETSTESNRTALLYLLGALALLLIPVVVGWIMTNRDSEGDNTGMADAGPTISVPSGSSTQIRDFLGLVDGPVVVDSDPSGTATTLRFLTKGDAVCSIVYGRTTEYGSIATDADMDGGAHRRHSPVLVDLQPGTTYVYRIQATTPNGLIWVSEPGQFTTPGGDGSAVTNLALEATVVETSSDFGAGFAGSNAIDGSLATEWSSQGDGNGAYIVIDLGREAEVTGIGFRTRQMSDGTSITNQFTVTIGGELFGPFEAGPGLATTQFIATGQVVRVDLVDTTGGNTGAVEIEIYGR
ncbi:MAG TPA: discoidin domain-containing protein [Acidimicrobiia bacterium]|nr:discoidin domain-containing protein [Acidimicrobiia bacterium]